MGKTIWKIEERMVGLTWYKENKCLSLRKFFSLDTKNFISFEQPVFLSCSDRDYNMYEARHFWRTPFLLFFSFAFASMDENSSDWPKEKRLTVSILTAISICGSNFLKTFTVQNPLNVLYIVQQEKTLAYAYRTGLSHWLDCILPLPFLYCMVVIRFSLLCVFSKP